MANQSRPSSTPQQDPQSEVRRIAMEAMRALDSGIDISDEAVQTHVSAIKGLYSRNPKFKDNFDNILGSFNSPKMRKFVSSNFGALAKQRGNVSNSESAEKFKAVVEKKGEEIYQSILADNKSKDRNGWAHQENALLGSALSSMKNGVNGNLMLEVKNYVQAKLKRKNYVVKYKENPSKIKKPVTAEQKKDKPRFTTEQQQFLKAVSAVDPSSADSVKNFLATGDISQLTSVIDKFKANPALVNALKKKSGKSAKDVISMLGNLKNTDVSSKGIGKSLGKMRSFLGMKSIDLASLNPDEESYKLLTRPLKLQAEVGVKNTDGKVENKMQSMDTLGAIQICINPETGLLNQGQLSKIFKDNYLRMATGIVSKNKKQAAEVSKTKEAAANSQGAARGATGLAALGTLFASISGKGKNKPFNNFTAVFDLGSPKPLLDASGKIPSSVSIRIDEYIKSLAKTLDKNNYKDYAERETKAGRKPMAKDAFNAQKIKNLQGNLVKRNQANIDANLASIPEHRLGSPHAASYAKLLAEGKINMAFSEYMEKEVFPKMHPLMQIFYMIQEILGMLNNLGGGNPKKKAKKLAALKESSGINDVKNNIENQKTQEEERRKTEKFLGGDFWKGINIKISNEDSFKINKKGEDVPKENFEKRFAYFNGKHEKQDNFQKLLSSENPGTVALKSKGISLKNLKKIDGLGDKVSVVGNFIEFNNQSVNINSETLDADISKAFEKIGNLNKVDNLINKSDIMGNVSQKVRDLITKEDPKNLTEKKIKNLVERGRSIIDSSIKLDSTLKISDFDEKLFEGNKFNKKAKAIFKLKGTVLKKEDIDLIASKLDEISVVDGGIKFKEKNSFILATTFTDIQKLILALNGGKSLSYKETEKRKEAEKAKSEKAKTTTGKNPDKKDSAGKPAEKAKAKITLREEAKNTLNKTLEKYSGKLDGITAEKIPKNLITENGELSKSFQSLLKLDDKFWGGVKLNANALGKISNLLGDKTIKFKELNTGREWSSPSTWINGRTKIKAVGLKIGTGNADRTFENIADLLKS